jgi:DNA-binding transcriptional LysR family regulator
MHILSFKYFLAVAETGSVRQAATELHVSPSALSRQIQNLEHSFRTQLFDRRASGMHLTEEGAILALHMRRTVREMELARARIDGIHEMVAGTIRYATIEGAMETWLFPAMMTFQQRFPEVAFEGQVVGSEAVYAAISSDQVDFGVAMETALPLEIDIVERFDTGFMAVMTADHPLAKQESLTLVQIAPYRLAMLGPSFQTRQLVNASAARQQLGIQIVFELNHIEMLKFYVQATDGITILPDYAVSDEASGGLVTVAIKPGELQPCATLLCKRRDRHLIQAADSFIEQVRQFRTAFSNV